MNMYQQTGTFTPDSLIVSPDFPILKEGIGMKAGYGTLERGSVIVKDADGAGYIAGTTVEGTEMKLFGILTDDTETGSDGTAANIPATVYQTGEFNRAAVKVAEGSSISSYEDDLKGIGIYLRSVQEYE